MIKYHTYKFFVRAIDSQENVFISGNSKKSAEVMRLLRDYHMQNVYFNWQDKNSLNIMLYYDPKVDVEQAVLKGNTLVVLIGERTREKDLAYTILSGYYLARSKVYDNHSNLLCL